MKLAFDAKAFGNEYISRKARRWISEFFERLPKDVLTTLIREDRVLVDYFPQQVLTAYRAQAQQYRDLAALFNDNDVYLWIPQPDRSFIESFAPGKQWALRQIALLRQYLFS